MYHISLHIGRFHGVDDLLCAAITIVALAADFQRLHLSYLLYRAFVGHSATIILWLLQWFAIVYTPLAWMPEIRFISCMRHFRHCFFDLLHLAVFIDIINTLIWFRLTKILTLFAPISTFYCRDFITIIIFAFVGFSHHFIIRIWSLRWLIIYTAVFTVQKFTERFFYAADSAPSTFHSIIITHPSRSFITRSHFQIILTPHYH